MAATSYDALAGRISLEVNGVPYPVLIDAINMSARDLCVQSDAWVEWQTLPLIGGINEYQVDAPSGNAAVRHVKKVLLGGNELQPVTQFSIVSNRPALLTQAGEPSSYFMLSDMSIRVLPTPTINEVGKSISVYAAFVPTIGATTIDAALVDRNAEVLMVGTKAKLMTMNNVPWSNPQLGSLYDAQFKELITRTRIDVLTDYGMADLSVRKRRFSA